MVVVDLYLPSVVVNKYLEVSVYKLFMGPMENISTVFVCENVCADLTSILFRLFFSAGWLIQYFRENLL